MAEKHTWQLRCGVSVNAAFSERSDGDLRIDREPERLAHDRATIAPLPWTWLRQAHGARVVTVSRAGEHAGAEADASVTATPGAVLAVQTADCAPVLMFSSVAAASGAHAAVVGAVHAGWRGIEAGVIGSAVRAMAELGAEDISWTMGPCISPQEYEFSATDLDRLASVLGGGVRSHTSGGRPALDLRAAVHSAMAAAGIQDPPLRAEVPCTAASSRYWSHRRDGDASRQASVIWFERMETRDV